MRIYLASWVTFCAACALLLVLRRRSCSLLSRAYLRFLLAPWKVASAALATAGLVLMAPYTNDPTWDYVDAGLMAVMTCLTAPWSVGTIFRVARRRAALADLPLAACLWLLSASWSYDLYILLRHGVYPPSWAANLVLSSLLYGAAGLLWNLDWQAERGVFLSFTAPQWPLASRPPLWRIAPWALVPMLLCASLTLPFLCLP